MKFDPWLSNIVDYTKTVKEKRLSSSYPTGGERPD